MANVDTATLIESFNRTHWIIKKQSDGLSQSDSLLQPSQSGNCLNWVVGHIVAGRNSILAALGEAPLWSDEELALYKRESEPITAAEQALALDRLLDDLDQTQTQIVAALEQASPEKLGQIIETDPGKRTVQKRIAFLHWHETYHTGQLELLRQLAGKADKII